jgi:MFS family permease
MRRATARSWRRPAEQPLEERHLLQLGLLADKDILESFTVPRHEATASAASPHLQLRLGHAGLVVPERELSVLQGFIRGAAPLGDRDAQDGAESILMVTGEPGAGKSVLMQELYQSLALGVIEGKHGLVPLIVFARDLNLKLLDDAEVQGAEGMLKLVLHLYQARVERGERDLAALIEYVERRWKVRDFLVIVDGLDEIAQRTAYEEIQKKLFTLVSRDVKAHATFHRYVLSCRVDEDLQLFHGAKTLRIPGLSEEMREAFCAQLLGQSISSYRLMPAHVFRRNPYFLSLLREHLSRSRERIQQHTLDFGYLMDRYLEREVDRPVTGVRGHRDIEDRRVDFREYEPVVRPCLQWLAFHYASAASIAGLYDYSPIDAALATSFLGAVGAGERAKESTPWRVLHHFLSVCTRVPRPELTNDELAELGILRLLREGDVRILDDLGRRLGSGRKGIAEGDVHLAFGRLPAISPEPKELYDKLARALMPISRAFTTPLERLAFLLMVRGIAASHVLRIVSVVFDDAGQVLVRFRHRRLAEYFAACYLRDRWDELEGGLKVTPWLGSVLNLTCALEGRRCRALGWMVQRLERHPAEPTYLWRYAAEEAVEASFFAELGEAYSGYVGRVVLVLVASLLPPAPCQAAPTPPCPMTKKPAVATPVISKVTEVTVLGLLASLGASSVEAGTVPPEVEEQFLAYCAKTPPEWADLRRRAEVAMSNISGKPPSAIRTIASCWRAMVEPTGHLRATQARSRERVFAWIAVATGELIWLVLVLAGVLLVRILLLAIAPEVAGEMEHWRLPLLLAVLLSYSAWRYSEWSISPTVAAASATMWWRFAHDIWWLVVVWVAMWACAMVLGGIVFGIMMLSETPAWPVLGTIVGTIVMALMAGGMMYLAYPLLRRVLRYTRANTWSSFGRSVLSVALSEMTRKIVLTIFGVGLALVALSAYIYLWRLTLPLTGAVLVLLVGRGIVRYVRALSRQSVARSVRSRLLPIGVVVAVLAGLWVAGVVASASPGAAVTRNEAGSATGSTDAGGAALGRATAAPAPPPPTLHAEASRPPAPSESAPSRKSQEVPLHEWFAAESVACEPLLVEPPSGLIGALRSVPLWWDVSSKLGEAAMLFGRVSGGTFGDSGALKQALCRDSPHPIDTMVTLKERLGSRIAHLQEMEEHIRARNRSNFTRTGILLFIAGMLLIAFRALIVRRTFRRDQAHLAQLHNVDALAAFIEDNSRTESARLEALRRIDQEGIHSDADLKRADAAASAVMARKGRVEQTIGFNMAQMVRAAGNRLRHRDGVHAHVPAPGGGDADT